MNEFLKKRSEERRQEFNSHISDEIRALIQRGNVTLEELNGLRCNSWEWQALVPVMTNEAFVDRMQYALDNCHTPSKRPFSTYNEAVEGLWAPELLKRFRGASLAARDYAETIDNVREALGQDGTHYLIIADDVKDLVEAVEYSDKDGGESARAVLRKLREDGMYRAATHGVHVFAGPKPFKDIPSLLDVFSRGSGPGLTEPIFPAELVDDDPKNKLQCSVCGARQTPLDGCRGTGGPCVIRRPISK